MTPAQFILAALALVALGLGGCGDDQNGRPIKPYAYNINVRVVTDAADLEEQRPLHSVPIKVDGKIIGYTDRDGGLEAVMKAKPGTSITIEAGQIEGYEYAGPSSQEFKFKVRKLSPELIETLPISFNTTARSVSTDYLVWLQLDCRSLERSCEGMPVKVKDEIVATTDAVGHAQFTHKSAPGQALEVTADASKLLQPSEGFTGVKNPIHNFSLELDKASTVYLLEGTLELNEPEPAAEPEPKKRVKRRRKRTRKRGAKKRTTRKRSVRKRSTPSPKKKKKKRSRSIDIFAD